jgi:ADP-ribose pyrophosphatase
MAFDSEDVDVLDDKLSYDGFFQLCTLTLRHRLFEGGWSKPFSREILLRNDAAGVLLYDAVLDKVALIEQFRIGAMGRSGSPWLLEVVAGLLDKDERPEEVAIRESLEEADCVVEALEPVISYFSSPGGSREFFHLFCGKTDLSSAGGIHGLDVESEDIRVHVLAVDDCWQKLQQGEIINAPTIIALQWLQSNRQRLRELWG